MDIDEETRSHRVLKEKCVCVTACLIQRVDRLVVSDGHGVQANTNDVGVMYHSAERRTQIHTASQHLMKHNFIKVQSRNCMFCHWRTMFVQIILFCSALREFNKCVIVRSISSK